MSVCLDADEMLEALHRLHHAKAGTFQIKLEQLGTEMARELGQALDCKSTESLFELGSACAAFHPKRHDQELPAILAELDEGAHGEWDDDAANLCTTCDEPNDDGEGWNQQCGNCADAAEDSDA